jgi:hypothetical protein
MMDNSWKYIYINAKALAKKLNMGEIYTKSKYPEVKKSSMKVITSVLQKTLEVKVGIVPKVSAPSFKDYIQLTYDWDLLHFDRNSEYENVYDFDRNFINHLKVVRDLFLEEGFDYLDISIIDNHHS